MTLPQSPRLSLRADLGVLRAAVEGDAAMVRMSRELETKYRIPKSEAQEFMMALGAAALDGMGELTLGRLTARFKTMNALRAQVGEALDNILSGKAMGDAGAQNLQSLFAQVKSEMEGLQKDLQQRELPKIADELSTKLKQDLEGTAKNLKEADPHLTRGRFYEPPGVLKEAYNDLARRKPALHKAFETARADPEVAALLQKALTAEEQTQGALIADAKARMHAKGASLAEVADLEKAVKELGAARRKALINNPETIEGRMKIEVLERIHDEDLAQAIAESDFILLPSAKDEFGGVRPFAMDAAGGASRLKEAWANFKAKRKIPEGQPLTKSQRSDFAGFWRENYLVNEGRSMVSERAATWELGRHEDLNILKPPKGYSKSGGTDIVGFKDNGEIWVADDKAWFSSKSASDVPAFTHEFADDILADVADFERQINVEWKKFPEPTDPVQKQRLTMARDAVERYRKCGEELKAKTAGWKKGEIFDPAKTAEFNAILKKYNVKLKVTSAIGIVSEVSERLKLLEVGVWKPPVP